MGKLVIYDDIMDKCLKLQRGKTLSPPLRRVKNRARSNNRSEEVESDPPQTGNNMSNLVEEANLSKPPPHP